MTQPDPSNVPGELRPFVAAIDIVSCRPSAVGWTSPEHPHAPVEALRPGSPPYDGVYRASWMSPGVCVRLDLDHGCVPPPLVERLRALFPEKLGADGNLYEYGVDFTSQRDNRDYAVDELRLAIVQAGTTS